ncbi:hypothetical protein ACJ73_04640 [Blastomyces percursus]|uniref:Uncharacterized protein n=1 Tax=Blastomyces percursus TaxID=1658174 RepID=A0A1J9Q691_9EURO|nr:hypothetical protein ACJ73_04640 [Blastomyces percursus]
MAALLLAITLMMLPGCTTRRWQSRTSQPNFGCFVNLGTSRDQQVTGPAPTRGLTRNEAQNLTTYSAAQLVESSVEPRTLPHGLRAPTSRTSATTLQQLWNSRPYKNKMP